jgi:hypothetical protein
VGSGAASPIPRQTEGIRMAQPELIGVQKCLAGLYYPAAKEDLVEPARAVRCQPGRPGSAVGHARR